jgi:electron transfer flavoprotein alpha subunit
MIIGVIEFVNTALTEATQQMLTFARGLAGNSGLELAALVIGDDETTGLADELGKYGVTKVVRAGDEKLKDYAPVAWAKIVSQAMENYSAKIVMAAGTDRGNEVMAHLGAISNLPMAANCSAVSAEDTVKVTRFRWGSSLLEEALVKGEPCLLTIAPHVIECLEADLASQPAVETFSPQLTENDLMVRLVRRESDEAEGITLKTATVVVGGGRGVGSQEAYSVLEEFAGEIGAAVGCTRVATNNGWRPHSDQVGLTGTRISPTLYIACGISGAIQHLVGCKGAKNILVINKDPEAAFFSKADFGVLGDLHEILPAITAELRKVKA